MNIAIGTKVGVLMGGLSSEREVSLKSGRAVLNALLSRGYDAVSIDAGRDVVDRVRNEGIGVAFIALHGMFGEDGIVQSVLELLEIPYTGSGVLASAQAFDKSVSKVLFTSAGIPVPSGCVIESYDIPKQPPVEPPYVVKPASQGSTIGLSIVADNDAKKWQSAVNRALALGSKAIVEEKLQGKELTVGILDREPLEVVEIRPKGGLYDYERKYTPGETEYVCPADIEASVYRQVKELGLKSHVALGCRGATRADLILDEKKGPVVLEVNTVPGLMETSLLPKSAFAARISFEELVERMLKSASMDSSAIQEKSITYKKYREQAGGKC